MKVIWDTHIPARLNFILWELENHAVQTKMKLQKISPNLNTLYVLCAKEESLTHLFLTCELTHQLWCTLAQSYGMQGTVHTSFKQRMKEWSSHS